jgi:hypothetical protein
VQSTPIFSEICAFWAVAYLENLLPSSSLINSVLQEREKMEKEAASMVAW